MDLTPLLDLVDDAFTLWIAATTIGSTPLAIILDLSTDKHADATSLAASRLIILAYQDLTGHRDLGQMHTGAC